MTETRPTLLVVDDTAANIDVLIDALGDDYSVCVATDGNDALNSVKRDRPDLILLDIMMPEMDGFEVCRRVKDDPTSRDIPIIFLTAMSEDADEARGLGLGAADYITKPFNLAIVKARVRYHLELCRQKQELQQSYDKLRELETQRDSLVHMIVHDMRSPLTSILGRLQMAQKNPLSEKAAGYMAKALESTNELMEMISTLLDVSKMEAGLMTLDYSAVNMRVLVSETLRMVEPLQGQRKLTLTSPEEMEALSGDTHLIRRILQNLVGNALKFTDKEEGVITVRIEIAAKDRVRVSVTDNGPGIPLEYREKVFDKFCQVEARKQGKMYSTGLGLTFCKLAVEAHGGRIGLNSEPGKGSTFWFELPR